MDLNALNRKQLKQIAIHILEKTEDRWIQKTVGDRYYYFCPDDKRYIKKEAKKALILKKTRPYFYQDHLRGVRTELLDCAKSKKTLDMNGFTLFRLRDYRQEVVSAVDEAAETLKDKRFRLSLIRFLKTFVDFNPQGIETLHITWPPEGGFQLLDRDYRPLKPVRIGDWLIGDYSPEHPDEDQLLSAVLTLSPGHLIIHGPEKRRMAGATDILRQVFGTRASLCRG
jgi:putative sporulation protein YtxC